MIIDLSIKVDKSMIEGLMSNADVAKFGHVGTHFDIMNREFPVKNAITDGRIFDIRHISGEVKPEDVQLDTVNQNEFVIFYSGILQNIGYGSEKYFSTYTELSDELINVLVDRNVAFIGIDMAGAKKPADHPRIDLYCADHDVYIIENLTNLDLLLQHAGSRPFKVYTFPVNITGFTGLPCRIMAETESTTTG